MVFVNTYQVYSYVLNIICPMLLNYMLFKGAHGLGLMLFNIVAQCLFKVAMLIIVYLYGA
jgi:hypothetical protein